MNADRLLGLFDQVAAASDAVPRLRRFVLDLAVRGKLVEQDPADEVASDILVAARCRLERQASLTRRMRWKATEPVAFDELERDLPQGWVPARVNDTGLYINGLAFKPADWKKSGLPIIRIQNLTDPSKEFNFAKGDFPDEVLVRDGDLLVSWSATLEAFLWERGDGVLNQHIFRVIPDAELTVRDYLLLLLKNAIREMAESEHAHGLVMTHINRGPFLNHVVLIPPLAEQHRIVAKVDQLMTICNRLEETQAKREDARDKLTNANYARLSIHKPDDVAFRPHARFAISTFPTLTAHASQIKRLRQAILDLAIRGKLVKQDPEDEPASELLKRIAEKKSRLRAPHDMKPFDADEIPFSVPVGWLWCRIGDLCTKTGSGSTPRGGKNVYGKVGVPFLRSQNVYDDGLRLENVACIEPDIHARMAGTVVRSRDLLLNITGGSMGRCCRVPDQFGEANVSQHVAIIRPAVSEMADFLHKLVLSPYFQSFIFNEQTGAGRGGLPKNRMDRIAVAIPPLAEQRRIVAKVDEVMKLCDRLEANLELADAGRRRLLACFLETS